MIGLHHHRRKNGSQNHSLNYQMLFNIHNPNQDHRDRGQTPAASFLPLNRKRLGMNSEPYSKLVSEAFPMLTSGYSTGIPEFAYPTLDLSLGDLA
jgi:hypothetical protein